MLDLMRVLYRDENVLLRTKLTAASVPMVAPLVAQIIQQGVAEGVFAVEHPMESALIVFEIRAGLVQRRCAISVDSQPTRRSGEFQPQKPLPLAALDRRVDAYDLRHRARFGRSARVAAVGAAGDIRAWLL